MAACSLPFLIIGPPAFMCLLSSRVHFVSSITLALLFLFELHLAGLVTRSATLAATVGYLTCGLIPYATIEAAHTTAFSMLNRASWSKSRKPLDHYGTNDYFYRPGEIPSSWPVGR